MGLMEMIWIIEKETGDSLGTAWKRQEFGSEEETWPEKKGKPYAGNEGFEG